MMKHQAVLFCEGCGQMLDDIQPAGGQAQWIDAHAYLMKYGFQWEDLDRIDATCASCARVFHAGKHQASSAHQKKTGP